MGLLSFRAVLLALFPTLLFGPVELLVLFSL